MIKLGQALKLSGLVSSGADAKSIILDGCVKVNGSVELRRGRKLYDLDQFEYQNQIVQVHAQKEGLDGK
jgi:ribosome-associated protein